MQRDNRFKNLHDRLDGMRARPTVALFVDADSVLTEVPHGDNSVSKSLLDMANAIGRVMLARVYYERGRLDPPVNESMWQLNGFATQATGEEMTTEEGINLPLMFDAYDHGRQLAFDVYVLAVGAVNYNALAKRLINAGSTTVIVSNYPKDQRTLTKESCVYVPLHTVITKANKPKTEKGPQLDVKEFDFTRFIEVLAESEKRMPFVGAKYFVTRTMYRVKGPRAHVEKQAVFQEAADRGIIELYEEDNIDGSENNVTAVRLNRSDPLVQKVLGIQEVAPDGDHQITITIEGSSSTETVAAPSPIPAEQISTL